MEAAEDKNEPSLQHEQQRQQQQDTDDASANNEKRSLSSASSSSSDGGDESAATSPKQQRQQQPLCSEKKETKNLAVAGYAADKSSAGSSSTNSDNDEEGAAAGAARSPSKEQHRNNGKEDKLGLMIDILQQPKIHQRHRRRHHAKTSSSSSSSDSYSSETMTQFLLSDRHRRHDRKRKRNKTSSSSGRHHRRSRKHLRTMAVLSPPTTNVPLESLSKKSPIHPDIDISLTQHIAIKNDLLSLSTDSVLRGAAVGAAAAAVSSDNLEIASSVPALSSAVLHYFAELRKDLSVRKQEMNALAAGVPNRSPPPPSDKNRKRVADTEAAQVITDVASFSDQPYRLEDALDLTETPRYVWHSQLVDVILLLSHTSWYLSFLSSSRLLLEATSPHRVIHVNAAFSRKIIAAAIGRLGNSAQEWMEAQNQSYRMLLSKHRTLQEALEEIIPENATVPLTCYPVLGAGNITHYLIEASAARAAKVSDVRKQLKSKVKDEDKAFNTERREENAADDSSRIRDDLRHESLQLYKPYEAVG